MNRRDIIAGLIELAADGFHVTEKVVICLSRDHVLIENGGLPASGRIIGENAWHRKLDLKPVRIRQHAIRDSG